MKKASKRIRKIRNLIIVCSIWATFLIVSTYAWFIGMKTVNVSKFDISIATTEGLFLSMDGVNWSYNLDAKNATAYHGNTNSWADDGLIPMSTIGNMDSDVSRMILFEKGSLTTTNGGYRLLASRVDNYSTVETSTDGSNIHQGKGYVVFDLFIKNLSGAAYYKENDEKNEEDIYLTTNSSVKVSELGGTAGTGIENSVRVAFAQIGRVIADETSNASIIAGISCKSDSNVTGICRNAQIWEPNDTKHETNVINWYNTSCKLRDGNNAYEPSSYKEGICVGINNTTGVSLDASGPAAVTKTYAVSRELNVDDYVDIYDGERYNTYTANTKTLEEYQTGIAGKSGEQLATALKNFKLVDFPYFTDTDKMKTKTERPTFMKLAPRSITKVRVYIYIEGQDIDNYDFASLGKQITVKFGFTKERYNPEDIDYVGPAHPATASE